MGESRKISGMPNTPVFSAYRATDQSVTDSVWTKVQCATDYVELFGYITGTTPEFTAGAALTYFQGTLVRSA